MDRGIPLACKGGWECELVHATGQKKLIEKEAELLWWENFFLGLTC